MAQISKEKEGHFAFVVSEFHKCFRPQRIRNQPPNHVQKLSKLKKIIKRHLKKFLDEKVWIPLKNNCNWHFVKPFLQNSKQAIETFIKAFFLLFSRQKLLNTCKVIQTHKFCVVWQRFSSFEGFQSDTTFYIIFIWNPEGGKRQMPAHVSSILHAFRKFYLLNFLWLDI